jgi:TrmH family RNA methyltransferase
MLSKNQIKEIQSLHLKKFRDKEKLFIVEGVKTCLELIKLSPENIQHIFCTEHFYQMYKTDLLKFAVILQAVNETELKKISLQENPNEVLVVSKYFQTKKQTFNFEKDFTLFLDDVRDPGNMGTILRLADWFGIRQLYASPNSCDIYNPKVIQASMGAFLRVGVIYDELSNILQTQKITNVYGALLKSKSLYQEKLSAGLIIIGNEANGIHQDNIKHVSKPITIPASQGNGTESLNAAMATAIIVAEFCRQLKL